MMLGLRERERADDERVLALDLEESTSDCECI